MPPLSIREDPSLDKTLISLLSGASALALLGSAQASAAPSVGESDMLQPARSFAELLEPIPNAEKVLRAEDERSSNVAAGEEAPMEMAQYHHHHHHHHHYHHHHYHHHHHTYY